jgi:predicted DNA-binding protein
MEPYKYLQQVTAQFDTLDTREAVNQVLDEMEFLYEALGSEMKDIATGLIEQLHERLKTLP